MCTVTYVPSQMGSIITANRDEAPIRNAEGLVPHFNASEEKFLIAKEPLHGGTNLAAGVNLVAVLINGAFVAHERKMSYRKSRGIVLLESLNFDSLTSFQKEDLYGVEPFTLLHFGSSIEELRWDEYQIHYREINVNEPFIVASAKLYTPQVLAKRQNWFKEVINNSNATSEDLLNFHLRGGDGDPENDMVMNRNDLVRTVSVSQIDAGCAEKKIKHFDLLREKKAEFTL
ncbi:MAG: hypothetical protein MK086_01905 [Flavobacteriales bacterium]|nr:hypothetical protein [Flavobacteriales bacterium]